MEQDVYAPFQFPIEDKSENIIKVIGVGGGGGNAVQHMWEEGVKNVTFFVVNTDSQVLSANRVPNKVQLGDGLGAGGNPEKGRRIAENCIENIRQMFDEGTKMVFITAGMGGGTGTGATPVIARIAKEMGILTVGVVTLPFRMEGRKRIETALQGLEEVRKCVDSLIVINNERLLEDERYAQMDWNEGMKKADEVLTIATKIIAEIITVRGMVNRDFNDVYTVMKDGGAAVVSVAKESGEKRVLKAMSAAINSPLLSTLDHSRARRLLYIVYSGQQNPVKIPELTQINEFMERFDEDIEVLWGHYPDDTLDDEIKVSIVATGFDQEDEDTEEAEMPSGDKRFINILKEKYYHIKSPVPPKDVKEETETTIIEQPQGTVTETTAASVTVPASPSEAAPASGQSQASEAEPAPEAEPRKKRSFFTQLVEKLNEMIDE